MCLNDSYETLVTTEYLFQISSINRAPIQQIGLINRNLKDIQLANVLLIRKITIG